MRTIKNICPVCDTDIDRIGIGHNSKPRSYEQHKRYFKMVHLAYTHWPVTHERQFSNEKECRKFLQMKAGHFYESDRLIIDGVEGRIAARIAEAAFKAADAFSIAVPRGGDLVIYSPSSVSFDKLSHSEACTLYDKVNWIIRDEIGVSGDDLLERDKESA